MRTPLGSLGKVGPGGSDRPLPKREFSWQAMNWYSKYNVQIGTGGLARASDLWAWWYLAALHFGLFRIWLDLSLVAVKNNTSFQQHDN